eukprot:CAMPEP_0194299790 /NCGR_PEP_ID=MMETSP0169-20130528/60904_1 /TAXON_ID=218684 /ORGANISM="Corethron pennatum, Strain L29A3" /LENGTH=81 /DNA_ID=CAMNT_0039049901 /DNA_START=356 /DNA_END=601 /DNA_ORIENTATION=-
MSPQSFSGDATPTVVASQPTLLAAGGSTLLPCTPNDGTTHVPQGHWLPLHEYDPSLHPHFGQNTRSAFPPDRSIHSAGSCK